MIFGGEPLNQPPEDLKKMLDDVSQLDLPIWLFTRYDLEDVPPFVIDKCTYIKTGRYLQDKLCDNNIQFGIQLASQNQRINKMAA